MIVCVCVCFKKKMIRSYRDAFQEGPHLTTGHIQSFKCHPLQDDESTRRIGPLSFPRWHRFSY